MAEDTTAYGGAIGATANVEGPSGFDFRGLDVTNTVEASDTGKPAGKSGKGTKGGKGKAAKSAKAAAKAGKSGKPSKGAAGENPAKDAGPLLFRPITLRGLTIRNRIWLPPMDTYSAFAQDGRPTPFHYQHYVSRAMGGFGLIIAEATAVAPEGRISPNDVGLWADWQIDSWKWIVEGIKATGAAAAIQLNHAGRKGSTGSFTVGYERETVPGEAGGWPVVAPSAIPFGGYATPRALSVDEIHGLVGAFAAAAGRAVAAGFQAIEIHAAHGYLISQFLDPLGNERDDEYGGGFEGRTRFLLEVADAIRGVIPDDMPLLVRVSATDWAAGGWDLDQTVALAQLLKAHGVDLVDVSTGGIIAGVTVPVKPDYQVPFSAQVRKRAEVPVTAVGLITKPKQAEKVLAKGKADAVEIGRAALRDPYWPLRAADKLGVPVTEAPYQPQYVRGAY
ncbi:NADH:flavin oxidoreductase/NADH oxidase [Bifidobacterium stellenboschense]|uniref:NADH-dependent flavin oxidoreductase n=1 Tax=Bifidobacterium stellenboschense TaxID=762211 RepID=A0A087DWY0_9BIFI|nr:NADH:flavin oxidoreductase/NADH oxidase [Bifidobacterium stellenboschense]KFJ00031.1 NADH-dependent flavin oxidoreductase [Bifidobacterium stellenboschense]